MNFPSLIIQILCLLASITLFFQASVPRYLKAFPFFMLITLVVEVTAWLLLQYKINVTLLYIVFTSFEFMFYLFIVAYSIYNLKVRKIILWLLAVYPVLVLLNRLFIQQRSFHTITYSIGCLLVVAACIFYFFELFQSTHSVNLIKEPAFWICSGLLFFYCCTFPLIGLWNYLHNLPGIILKNLNYILTFLNILLYSLFSIAFLCRLRYRRSLR
ncbi:hypothetical protein [Niastella populi]|uniref:Uncharacterized protein n=1 Tax=Niastella populi TaxID=550983 RepID=A0A1V9FJG3_9BACT|nr:hypothetical protein [Niastella populi]OQP58503.1 hypothetical protein A4R26_03345 [Niastella populi]